MDEKTPLFPAFSHHAPTHQIAGEPGGNADAEWLQNSTFTTEISVINDAVSKYEFRYEEDEKEKDDRKGEELDGGKRYERVPSSPSDESGFGQEYDTKKKKEKKRRKKGESAASYDFVSTLSSSSRKPGIQKWASSSNDKEYYFDSRGDRDNLAFGCIYRMDVSRYKLFTSSKGNSDYSYFKRNMNSFVLDGDVDIDTLDMKLKSEGRYWSPKYAAMERHKSLKRVRVFPPKNHGGTPTDDFIPITTEFSDRSQVSSATVIEESWEEEVLRKTKDFNRRTREHPHDESVWLDFAGLQDKVAGMQPQKGARLQTLEKKISILENAIAFNPDSEDLLLCLMKAYRSRDTTDTLIKRWEKILAYNSGSCKLWKDFLRFVQGEFSRFKVSDMRKMYANAIQALAGACMKQHRQTYQFGHENPPDPAFVQLELGLVDVFLGLCRLEWQAGYQELATALFQAEIEYSLFPPLGLSEQSKRRLFEHFWSSNCARIGEDGAVGWSTWLQKEEEKRQRLMNEKSSDVADEGGWTGWFEPPSKASDMEISETAQVDIVAAEPDEGSDTEDGEQKDDVESLLKALGIGATAEADIKITDSKTWSKWSKEELARNMIHWMPLHLDSGQDNVEDAKDGLKDEEQLLSTVIYEDVSDYMFSLYSEEARLSLIFQFIDFYEGRITPWTCTNSSNWVEKALGMENIPYSLMEDVKKDDYIFSVECKFKVWTLLSLAPIDTVVRWIVLLKLLEMKGSEDLTGRSNMMEFLRNALLLCLDAFPRNYILEEGVLVAEELSNTRMNSKGCSVTPCRALARSLLKNNRQDVLLCGVYARREASFGNIDQSRKVFDMALLSIEELPPSTRPDASLLYFWYAEVELEYSPSRSSDSLLRVLHILSCLGSGERYFPYKAPPSSLQQLRARQGFKDHVRLLGSTWSRGMTDDHSAALICSAALFEELTSGWASSLEILEQLFTMVLLERRRRSRQLEFLFHYYVKILFRNRMEIGISKVWEAIEEGMQIYPLNPYLHGLLVEISYLHGSPNKLRWTLDDHCQKRPSIITYLYALSFEMSVGGSKHRIRSVFEKALEDGKFHHSVILWRLYIGFETSIACDASAAKRVFFRAIHACPWSKKLWLDGFVKLESVVTAKEMGDLQEVMREKELNLRTDIYEILLQDGMELEASSH